MGGLETAEQTIEGLEAVPCIRCGYDLRGLTASGTCPECGLGVGRTLAKRERLEECPPGWVRRLSVCAGVLLLTALWQGAVLVYLKWARGSQVGVEMFWLWKPVRVEGRLDEVLLGVGTLPQLVAAWVMTWRESGRKVEGWVRRWSWVWRACALAGVAGNALWVASWWLGWSRWGEVGIGWLIVMYAAYPAVGFWRLKWLAERIGRPKLAEYAGIAGVGLSALVLERTLFDWQRVYQDLAWVVLQDWAAQYQGEVYGYEIYEFVRFLAGAFEVAVPAVVCAVVAGGSWVVRRRRLAAGWAWGAAVWLAASGLAVMEADGGYTRRLWSTVAVVGVLTSTTIVFYGWGLALLWRITFKFWQAANDAARAWREADASGG